MDRLFGTLFTLYIISSIVIALVRKIRTDAGPSLPPVARPDPFPWESEVEPEPPVASAPSPPSAPTPPEPVEPAVPSAPSQPPTPHTPSASTASTTPSRSPVPTSPPPAAQESPPAGADQRRSGGPVVGRAAGADAVAPRVHKGKPQLTAAKLREALILTEILSPPRALRPYIPPFVRRK